VPNRPQPISARFSASTTAIPSICRSFDVPFEDPRTGQAAGPASNQSVAPAWDTEKMSLSGIQQPGREGGLWLPFCRCPITSNASARAVGVCRLQPLQLAEHSFELTVKELL
jgi:hypothetical protein